jgi:hypothetical protein
MLSDDGCFIGTERVYSAVPEALDLQETSGADVPTASSSSSDEEPAKYFSSFSAFLGSQRYSSRLTGFCHGWGDDSKHSENFEAWDLLRKFHLCLSGP